MDTLSLALLRHRAGRDSPLLYLSLILPSFRCLPLYNCPALVSCVAAGTRPPLWPLSAEEVQWAQSARRWGRNQGAAVVACHYLSRPKRPTRISAMTSPHVLFGLLLPGTNCLSTLLPVHHVYTMIWKEGSCHIIFLLQFPPQNHFFLISAGSVLSILCQSCIFLQLLKHFPVRWQQKIVFHHIFMYLSNFPP